MRPRTRAPLWFTSRRQLPLGRVHALAWFRLRKRGVRRVGGAVAGAAAQQKNDLIAVGAAAALGYAEKPNESTGKPNFELPSFGGYDPAVLWGLGLGFVAPRIPGLKSLTRSARAAGIGLLCVGVNRSVARGSAKVSGEDD